MESSCVLMAQERIDELSPQLDSLLGQLSQQIDYYIGQIYKQLAATDRYINRAVVASEALENQFNLYCKAVIAEKRLIPLRVQACLQTKLSHFDLVFGHSTIQGRRETNEDDHAVFDIDLNGQRFTVAAVFDGHAGAEAARLCGYRYYDVIKENVMFPHSLEATLRLAFKKLDKEVVLQQLTSGCTAVSIIFDYTTNTLFAANSGDARCVCGTTKYVIECTHDHKPDKKSERARIEAYGSFVSTSSAVPRVNGGLAISRSIGDEEYKQYGVISEPECYSYDVNDLLYCVVACDGVFDVLNNQYLDVIIRSCLGYKAPTDKYYFIGKVGVTERGNFEKTAKMLDTVAKLYFKGEYEAADQQIMDKMATTCGSKYRSAIPTMQMDIPERIATIVTRISYLMGSQDNITCLFGYVK